MYLAIGAGSIPVLFLINDDAVASHGPQLANGGRTTGLLAGRRKDGKKKRPKRCLACVKAGRDPECYSCKGRGDRAWCLHQG